MITSFKSKNFCQHTDFECEFHPRMTAILGSNGSGKSNILAGIIGSLANEWINTGNKDENVSAGEAGASFVQVGVEHDNNKLDIIRGLRDTRSRLIRPGEEDLLGESEVTNAVLETLGITKRMLMDYVLVRQGSISGILSATMAERSKAYQQLFGTIRCEEIYQASTELIHSLSATVDLSRMDELKSRQKELNGQKEEICKRDREISKEMPSPELLKAGAERIADSDKWTELRARGVTLAQRLGRAMENKEEAEHDLASVDLALDGADRHFTETSRDAEEGQVQLRLAAAYSQAAEKRDRQDERILELTSMRISYERDRELQLAEMERLPLPSKARTDVTLQEKYSAEIQTYQILISGMEGSNLGVDAKCPLCKTTGVDLSNLHSDLSARLWKASEKHEELAYVEAEWIAYDQKKDKLETEEKGLLALGVAAQNNIEILKDALIDPPEPVDEADWGEKIKAFESAKDRRVTLNKSATEINLRISTSSSTAAEIQREIEHTTTERLSIEELSAEERRTIEEAAITAEKLKKEQATAAGRLTAIDDHLKDVNRDVAALEQEKEAGKRRIKMAEKMENVRSAFHRNGIPAEVSRAYLKALVNGQRGGVGINDLLRSFSSTFRAEVREEDLSFWAHFDDGRVQPAERLSGGEKVVLALALRTAVNSMFASSLSMLFLDEPTEYLDEANLDCLQTAMDKLGQVAEQKGLQVIVITHEKALAHLFDHTIEL